MAVDGVGKGSRVVGSADFQRPVVPRGDDAAGELVSVEGVRCAMPFKIKFGVPSGRSPEDVSGAVSEVAQELFDEVEATLSGHNSSSELSRLNELGAGVPHVMSDVLKTVVLTARDLFEATRGAFDPAVAPMLERYASSANATVESPLAQPERSESGPADDHRVTIGRKTVGVWRALLDRGFGGHGDGELSRALQRIREFSTWRHAFELSPDGSTISKLHDKARLDLSGLSKGWAIDELVARVAARVGLQDVFVDWAGDIKVKGRHPSGRAWSVAVAEPPSLEHVSERARKVASTQAPRTAMLKLGTAEEQESAVEYLAVLELRDGQAVATSGDYEQVLLHDGKLFSHILNPRTGRLHALDADAIAQAVVVSSSCMHADALATAAVSCEDAHVARTMLDPLRTALNEPVADFLLYARGGPRIVRMSVPGVESAAERTRRLEAVAPARVIVVGGGLAGLSAAIQAADTKAQVTLLEKEGRTGGNSAKATSGINAWGTETQAQQGIADEERLFERDTFRSGVGGCSNTSLVRTLSTQSAAAVHWLKRRFNIPLDVLFQLGGHAAKRTHRAPPDANGNPVPIGYLIMKTLRDAIDAEYAGRIEVRCGCAVTELIHEVDESSGVKTVKGVRFATGEGATEELLADAVVLTTGGFGCDRTSDGLMAEFRPDLAGVPTTNGAFAVGDGVRMARQLGVELVDMDKVQLHPTGFIDPKDPANPTKFLAPEAIRGSGGVLVNSRGERFVDELDLRSVVAKAIQDNCQPYQGGGDTDGAAPGPPFAWCILSPEAQDKFGRAFLDFYRVKLGLWESCPDVDACAGVIGCDAGTLRKTLREYAEAQRGGHCPRTNKFVFPSALGEDDKDLVLARVTPSIHYTMGGMNINAATEVQERLVGTVVGHHRHIRRLFAAGECTGGVHGNNRLGGNSLLECVVFGRLAGDRAATVQCKRGHLFHEGEDEWKTCVMREVRNTDEKFGKNTREIRFNLHGSLQVSGLKVGQYIAVRGEVDGETLLGYFSPITRPSDEGVLGILCRVDDKGGPIVRLLQYIRPGSTVQLKAMGGLRLEFTPEGIFWKQRQVKRFGLLAGGTGIAPMIQIIREYCHFAERDMERTGGKNIARQALNLVFAAEEESDLAYVKILHDLRHCFPQHFRFYLILNRPPLGWTEGVGFVKPGNIKQHMFFPPAEDQLVVICGPPVFESIMLKTLDRLGFPEHLCYGYARDD